MRRKSQNNNPVKIGFWLLFVVTLLFAGNATMPITFKLTIFDLGFVVMTCALLADVLLTEEVRRV